MIYSSSIYAIYRRLCVTNFLRRVNRQMDLYFHVLAKKKKMSQAASAEQAHNGCRQDFSRFFPIHKSAFSSAFTFIVSYVLGSLMVNGVRQFFGRFTMLHHVKQAEMMWRASHARAPSMHGNKTESYKYDQTVRLMERYFLWSFFICVNCVNSATPLGGSYCHSLNEREKSDEKWNGIRKRKSAEIHISSGNHKFSTIKL